MKKTPEKSPHRKKSSKKCSHEEWILRFWVNSPAVIIVDFNAKNLKSIPHMQKNNIPILRRSTGGGTVFHDEGTLNFTFIKPKSSIKTNQKTVSSSFKTASPFKVFP